MVRGRLASWSSAFISFTLEVIRMYFLGQQSWLSVFSPPKKNTPLQDWHGINAQDAQDSSESVQLDL